MTAGVDFRPPVLALVTDRRRLLPDPSDVGAVRACLLEQARRAVEAAIDLFQIRERDLEAGELYAIVAAIVEVTRGSRTRVLVNDRVDVALAAGADGVHLRGDSLPAREVRGLAPAGFLIGRSVHSLAEALGCADDVDYLVAGTVFETDAKPGRTLLGTAGLAAIAGGVAVPVLAIGGVTIDRVGAVATAGAAGIAGIGLFLGSREAGGPAGCPGGSLVGVASRVRAKFDSAERAS